MHQKHMYNRKTLIVIIFGGKTLLYQPPYNRNFRYFEMKYLVPRALNLQDLTVYFIFAGFLRYHQTLRGN